MIRYTQKFGKEWKHDHKNFAERKVNMDRNAPIGVFDSGIGGLTVAREIMRQMPQERIVYFGDTARVPYGSKSQETVLRYSRQIIRFLKTQGVKAIVIACNTASACALETVRQELDIPIIGVIYAGARTAAEATHNGKIGVIGTEATIRSGIYTREMQKLRPDIEVIGKPCPLFVPLVEEGLFHDSVTDDKRERNANKDTRPSAKLSYARVSVQKACFVLDAIRGKDVKTALGIVTYNPRYASTLIKKLLESAVANAENNNQMNPENLYVAECFANKGPTMKRVKPRAQGRAYRIEKRMSHITIVLDEK